MTRRKELRGPGKCVYCLREVEKVTSDHVIPRSWFATSTPEDVELPQAPACEPCNRKWGKVENALRERLGFAIDPYVLGGEGIGDKSLRAIDPSKGQNPQDAESRLRNQERFRRRLKRVGELPAEVPVLPNIGHIAPSIDGEWLVDSIEATAIANVVKKWVTGLTYFFTKQYIDPQLYIVQAAQLGQTVPAWWRSAGLSERLEIGPGMLVERRYTSENPVVSFWAFSVWGRLELFGAVVPLESVL